jgi:transcriptional regulator GlxA family with amidase domain
MHKVTILGLNHSMATTIFGPMDILNQSGRLWNRLNNDNHHPFFDVSIASVDGQPIRSMNRVEIKPHCSIDEIHDTDLIIIASATNIDKILQKTPDLVDWIVYHYRKGTHVASICTGVFLLAETGLLDDKSATLHWGFTDLFKIRYPQIALQQDKMFLDHGRLYCSAGVTAGMDLSLYLVEKFCGRQAARQSAKTMVLAMDRKSQVPYDCLLDRKSLADPVVVKAQKWLEKNKTQAVEYNQLAEKYNISLINDKNKFLSTTNKIPNF